MNTSQNSSSRVQHKIQCYFINSDYSLTNFDAEFTIENKEYNRAEEYIEWACRGGNSREQIRKIVTTMCQNGDVQIAKQWINQNKSHIVAQGSLYGENEQEKKKKGNEYYKTIEEIVNNY